MNCLSSTRMMEIQSQMSERALELLALPADRPCMVLDVGCGSGLSGECLDEQGHFWYEFTEFRDIISFFSYLIFCHRSEAFAFICRVACVL